MANVDSIQAKTFRPQRTEGSLPWYHLCSAGFSNHAKAGRHSLRITDATVPSYCAFEREAPGRHAAAASCGTSQRLDGGAAL